MLKRIQIRNFKSFNQWFDFSLGSNSKFTFNTAAVTNNIVKHGMVYGKNATGKSNLGLAIASLNKHLFNTRYPSLNNTFLNANSTQDYAEFKYEFIFSETEVSFEFAKDAERTIYEKLFINDRKYIDWDTRQSTKADIRFAGAESLNKDISDNIDSVVNYVQNNCAFTDTVEKQIFSTFLEFVRGIVYFRALNSVSDYTGALPHAHKSLIDLILQASSVEKFELFLNDFGFDVQLSRTINTNGEEMIQIVYGNRSIDFFSVASSGMIALTILYSWLIFMSKDHSNKISFAYIDEFDAFYHFELAEKVLQHIHTVIPPQNSDT